MTARSPPLVVGIVNCTPDSFSDGGLYVAGGGHEALIAHAQRLVEQGADWIDVGGESTRPGAVPIDVDEECRRVLPVVAALRDLVPVSIDTTKPEVAARALAAGASIINDVGGLALPEMCAVSADARATVVMHARGNPRTMASLTSYDDVVAEVRDFLVERALRARSAEVWIDPGVGFAKTAEQSLAVLRNLDRLVHTGLPVFVGASRKSFIGRTLGIADPSQRLAGSLAAAVAAWLRGARALRVHDVAETRQMLDLLVAIEG